MGKKFFSMFAALAVFAATSGITSAQDAHAVLQKATAAVGDVKAIQFSATGSAGTLGQNFSPTSPWPAQVITSYTRTIDYSTRSSKEESTRTDTTPPALGGGVRFNGEQKQVSLVNGSYAWNLAGNAAQPAIAAADERQLQIWLTPQGFLKAALENNATAKAGKNGTVISFTAMGKFKVNGTVDAHGVVTKVDTWLPNPVLGDMLVETSYTGYKDFGGVDFPTSIVQKQGGYPVLSLTVTNVQTGTVLDIPVPDAVKQATVAAVQVKSQRIADGVWFMGGGSHNSVLIEYPKYLVMVEGPLSDERSVAVIAEAHKLVPNKPINYVVNTHHHFDHSSGLRAYVAEGSTIITGAVNKPFYAQAFKAPHTLMPDTLSQHPKPATFIPVSENYVLSDGGRTLQILHVRGETHAADMLIAYLPKEKILIEADDFTPAAANAPPPPVVAVSRTVNLYDNVQRLKLDVDTIAPLHGEVSTMAALAKAAGKS